MRAYLPLASILVSVVLAAALLLIYANTDSALALAQGADSLSDVFTAGALWWALRIAERPSDENHPFGHAQAEPIAALVAAVVAGGLAFEVIRTAGNRLLSDVSVELTAPVALAFGAKIVAKGTIAVLARRTSGAAARALFVDARNDVVVSALAVLGYVAARVGIASLDTWLALPVGVYIGYSGVQLARENIRVLMGEAPEVSRRQALLDIAAGVSGVEEARRVKARAHGAQLDVWMEITVHPEISVRVAHDIGERVEQRLLREPDVTNAWVHVHVDG